MVALTPPRPYTASWAQPHTHLHRGCPPNEFGAMNNVNVCLRCVLHAAGVDVAQYLQVAILQLVNNLCSVYVIRLLAGFNTDHTTDVDTPYTMKRIDACILNCMCCNVFLIRTYFKFVYIVNSTD